ncbi:MAG: twin-arginine translocase subunit TatC [Chloroflexi bacterium]|nr:twin-arginine translocase subunit TatC [Chloroflexota bacterium]MDA1270610.1 twin-arginine translocase subunit TatC [Chloroflexota bacterium]
MNSGEQTFMQHIGELRKRVLICVLSVLIGSAVAFVFFQEIIEILVRPARDLNVGTGGELIYTEVTELLTTAIKVSLMGGLVLASPVILFQAVMFVSPGLTGHERRLLFGFMPAVIGAFAGGVAFGYYILTPPALHFLLTFGGDVAVPLIRISNIINLMIRLLFWMGLAFETPLVMFLLAQLGIVTAGSLARFRRYWVVVAFVLAAIITPTVDPVNQALVAGPLLVLYEVGILLARLAGRNRRKSKALTST